MEKERALEVLDRLREQIQNDIIEVEKIFMNNDIYEDPFSYPFKIYEYSGKQHFQLCVIHLETCKKV